MNCPACGMDVSDSSSICPYCETRLSENDSSQYLNPPISGASKDDGSRKKIPIPTILLAIACVILVGICIYLSNSHEAEISAKNREVSTLRQSEKSLSQQISELDEKISALNEKAAVLEDENNSLEQQISDLSAENSNLLSQVADYNELYTELSSGNIGYASDTYYSHEGIVFMSSSETKKTITIVASKGTTYSKQRTLGNAIMEWNEDSWHGATSVTVTPNGKGISSFTFTNEKDSDTFKIIVVVTD